MTTRQMRHLLSLSAAFLTLAAAGVVAWVLIAPAGLDNAVHTPAQAAAAMRPADRQAAELPARSALITLSEKPLRQQLFDPPPPEPQRPPPPPPLPAVELISTVIPSQGAPSAWVREAAGGNTPRKVGVGDTLGPANNTAIIAAIEPSRLLVEHNGEVKPIERAVTSSGGRR